MASIHTPTTTSSVRSSIPASPHVPNLERRRIAALANITARQRAVLIFTVKQPRLFVPMPTASLSMIKRQRSSFQVEVVLAWSSALKVGRAIFLRLWALNSGM